jgi:hypothetical protein
VLPIEFSRISGDGRLTLVIDAQDGADVPTLFVLSARNQIAEAVFDLAVREGTTIGHIGHFSLASGTRARSACTLETIGRWARQRGFDAVVWTDLEPNFGAKSGHEFSLGAAERHLRSLDKSAADRARVYIRNAPKSVDTPLRTQLRQSGWLTQD